MIDPNFRSENAYRKGFVCDVCNSPALTNRYGDYCFYKAKHKEEGKVQNIITIADKEFYDSMPDFNS